MQIPGLVALVTGGGHRVGREIVLALGREGARVAVHYHDSRDEAENVVRELRELGTEGASFGVDLTDAHAAADLTSKVMHRFGRLDILVNSAASMEKTPLESVDVAAWERIMALNMRAPFFLSLEAGRRMRETGNPGLIVNISDLAAFETWPDYVVHCISKSGVLAVSRTLARMLAPEVRVNAIAPGAVLLPEGWPEDERRKIIRSTPLGRIGTPQDVAETVLFLARADYITGETVVVDGGRLIRH
jgi:pteridine reductase